ncbi:MAG: SpoIIE family protein phosphatase [Nitrosomonadales bacterium]|nr:SpoIIE family protein phosphatase [Nitrosomonadales bacterium]
MRLNLPVSNIEFTLPDGAVIVTKTDLKGVITYCNNAFVEVSGRTRDEIIGQPHNVVRHPDMPPEVFADLWNTIKSNKSWQGVVKNRRSDGSFYWAISNVTPLQENGKTTGYVAFRYKAAREQIDNVSGAYRELRNGSSGLHVEEGNIIRVKSRFLRRIGAVSVKIRLLALMAMLLGTLVVIGIFNINAAAQAHDRAVESLAASSTQAYALDTARIAESVFREQSHTWKDILIGSHDAALFEKHLKEFDKMGEEVDQKLTGLLKPIMQQVGLSTDQVDALLESHVQLVEKYHTALKSFDIHKPETIRIADNMIGEADRELTESFEAVVAKIRDEQLRGLGDTNESLEKSYRFQRDRSILILAAAAFGGLLLSGWFIIGILRPMRRVASKLDRVAELQQQFLGKILMLEEYGDRIDEEQRVGSFIMGRMTDVQSQLVPYMHRYTRPADHLSGDILIAAATPNKIVHVLLADAVGHGLVAAINVLPLCQSFYNLTDKGFSIEEIAVELNSLVNRFMPVDRFVSAALVSINRQARVIEVWNGGIPAPQLFDLEGRLLHSYAPRNLPLGILPEKDFSAKPEILYYDEDCQLCLFSDGLLEACSPQGEHFGNGRVIEVFARTAHGSRFGALIEELDRHLQGQRAHDDISLVLVDISDEIDTGVLSVRPDAQKATEKSDDWRIAVSLGANELKYLDVVPLLTQIVAKIHATREHRSALFLILSELFNNALDHGVLQLDSAIKLGHDGFDKFIQLREARMRELSSGRIDIEIERVLIEGSRAVKIRVADSGKGFDYMALQFPAENQVKRTQHGRGITLMKSMACKLEYSGSGNEVAVYYICG